MSQDRKIEDQRRIHEIVERYVAAGDSRRVELLQECFTEDATLTVTLAGGRKKVMDRASLAAGIGLMEGLRNSVHALGNVLIEVDGDTGVGTVLVIAYLATGPEVGGKVSVRGVRYDDEYVRQDGDWRIRKRSHSILWQYEAPAIAQGIPTQAAANG